MRRLVIVEHEVDDIELRSDEDDLECCVPQALRRVRPEEVKVSCYIYTEVEELGLEGDACCALFGVMLAQCSAPEKYVWRFLHLTIAS